MPNILVVTIKDKVDHSGFTLQLAEELPSGSYILNSDNSVYMTIEHYEELVRSNRFYSDRIQVFFQEEANETKIHPCPGDSYHHCITR